MQALSKFTGLEDLRVAFCRWCGLSEDGVSACFSIVGLWAVEFVFRRRGRQS